MDRRSSGELVAAHIRRLVVEGTYRKGERVRQDEIAQSLGVSRIPVREAIIALEREGWVTVEPHRGAFVNGIDADFVRDHFEVHGAIQGLTAERAVERADDAQMAAVREAADEVLAVDRRDAAAFEAATYRFVEALDQAAAAPRLSSITRVMQNLVPGNFFAAVPGAVEAQVEGVGRISTALGARDAAGASSAFADLLRAHGEALLRHLDEQGLFDEPPGRVAS